MLVSARHCLIRGRGEMRNKPFRLARGSLFLLVFFSTHGYAQQLATARVTVTDSSGGVVARARRALRNTGTGANRTASSKEHAVGAHSPFHETVLKLRFAGVRESPTTLITQDGIDYTTSISGVQRVSPSQDWVQEFRVVTSSYTADTGRSLGAIVNTVIKSGTND